MRFHRHPAITSLVLVCQPRHHLIVAADLQNHEHACYPHYHYQQTQPSHPILRLIFVIKRKACNKHRHNNYQYTRNRKHMS